MSASIEISIKLVACLQYIGIQHWYTHDTYDTYTDICRHTYMLYHDCICIDRLTILAEKNTYTYIQCHVPFFLSPDSKQLHKPSARHTNPCDWPSTFDIVVFGCCFGRTHLVSLLILSADRCESWKHIEKEDDIKELEILPEQVPLVFQ
jgi:hypothetical protein